MKKPPDMESTKEKSTLQVSVKREVTVEMGVGDSKVHLKKTKKGDPDGNDYEVGGNFSGLFHAKITSKIKKDVTSGSQSGFTKS